MSNPRPIPVPIEDAKTWTAKWQSENKTHCKAFLIPVDDLLICLQEMGLTVSTDAKTGEISATPFGTKVRAYLAIKPPVKPAVNSKLNGYGEKLLIVGTNLIAGATKKDDIYEDIVQDRKVKLDGEYVAAASKNVLGDPLIGSGAYDLTSPCPSACDEGSSLFHLPL